MSRRNVISTRLPIFTAAGSTSVSSQVKRPPPSKSSTPTTTGGDSEQGSRAGASGAQPPPPLERARPPPPGRRQGVGQPVHRVGGDGRGHVGHALRGHAVHRPALEPHACGRPVPRAARLAAAGGPPPGPEAPGGGGAGAAGRVPAGGCR